MQEKRKRTAADSSAARTTTLKRRRHTAASDLLSPLSDELLVRILSFLQLPDLLSLAPVSDRFYHLSGDSQIWKRLYYARFVLPRALRLPGFRNGASRDRKLHYSAWRTIWADGRNGGWVDAFSGRATGESRNWKRQYKLRHNWARGKCAVEELRLDADPCGDPDLDLEPSQQTNRPPKLLVKVLEGIAVTADLGTGLRAWDLKTKQLVAQCPLTEDDARVLPTCMALDGQSLQQNRVDIALGFADGSFGTWRLHTNQRRIVARYKHEASSNGELINIAFSYPYLLTATKSILISLYTFDSQAPPSSNHLYPNDDITVELADRAKDHERESLQERDIKGSRQPGIPDANASSDEAGKKKGGSNTHHQAPYLLTSLRSHTSRAPLALSLRETASGTVASIAYSFSTIRGWSIGIQELHIRPVKTRSTPRPQITTTHLAYTVPVKGTSRHVPTPLSPHPSPTSGENNDMATQQDDGPISLSYTHPYLLATLPDNTLILHLCTSSTALLSISPGIRLWGHTSGISDAEITARGRAVSVSSRGQEIRLWELEGRTNGRSIEVRPTAKATGEDPTTDAASAAEQWDDRRNWVGFDDEMVIVLKESGEGRESLLVYDFT
ncbi:hypothetical protein F4808DRAFT_321632 [Astrocystis sublimbata]|nr:hypothetical protein F4808DRAFT_321632 [Astrocystis sublimbata]